MGFISKDRESIAVKANTYNLNKIFTLPINQPVRECIDYVSHDAFRWGGLNKSGFEIYTNLLAKPMTEKELANATGRSLPTIQKMLKRMSNIVDMDTSEPIVMVEMIETKWFAYEVDLDLVAKSIGKDGVSKAKAIQYKNERDKHKIELIIDRIDKK